MYMGNRKIKFNGTERFGRLTPIECLERKDRRNRIVWKFKCDCGNETTGTASDVRLGRKLSCGCLNQEHCKNHLSKLLTKPNKGGPITKLYGNYRRNATHRGHSWSLTRSKFEELISKNCSYCGGSPATEFWTARNKTVENTLKYNGIDRIRNEDGYNDANCTTCCFFCNRMKMDMGVDEFLTRIKMIYERTFKT